MRHRIGCICACKAQRLLKWLWGCEVKEAYSYYTCKTYYVPCSLCQCLKRSQAASSSFSTSLNEWLEGMAAGHVVGLLWKHWLQPLSCSIAGGQAWILTPLHEIGVTILQHLKPWLTLAGCVTKIRLLLCSKHQGCWIIILYLFYCCWNKHFPFREKYNLLTMGLTVTQSVDFTVSGLCIEAILLN